MKKISVKNLLVLRRLESHRFERRLDEKRRKAARRTAKQGGYRTNFRRRSDRPGWEDYLAPKVLDLLADKGSTCEFFSQVHDGLRDGQRVRLVFQNTEKISSESLIYLLAQMHKLRLIHGRERITGTYPASRKIERLLSDSGFLSILGVRRRKIVGRPASGTRFVKCKSDVVVRGACIPELKAELLGDDLQMPRAIGKMVFRALSEAMANVQHHAYKSKQVRVKQLEGRWWLGAQLSVKKNFFELTFYDAGVGIPKTLTRKYAIEHIRSVLSLLPGVSPDDAQMIQAAVALGRSSTGYSHRGKGLLDIHKLISSVGAGALSILSRRGAYRYTPTREVIYNDENFVEGTLIKWELPLDKVVDAFDLSWDDYDEET